MTRYLIDVTRFMSRIGRGHPTGIDRVEIEYIKEINARDPNAQAVAKLGKDYIVLPAAVVAASLPKIANNLPVGRLGLNDAFRLKLPREQRTARQYFRAKSTRSTQNLSKLFLSNTLENVEYVNVGHSNLDAAFFQTLRSAGCTIISTLIHDMIPLDFPEFTRKGVSEQFEHRMKAVAQQANRIICNSDHTRARVSHYFSKWGSTATYTVAHLGVEPFAKQELVRTKKPYFVVLGTIEPRKNHQLLFDVWEKLAVHLNGDQMPHLKVIGRRGWNNDAVFRFLDTSPLINRHITEHSDLNDSDLAICIANSSGLLFPSHAEGFGLPVLEAAQLGVPVICSELDVFREVLGSHATYIDAADIEQWATVVLKVANKSHEMSISQPLVNKSLTIPRWEAHFRHVFGHTGNR